VRAKLSRESAEERLIEELGKFREWHNPVTAFYFFTRTRREISLYTFSMLMDDVDVLCPYLDTDVVNFLMGLPEKCLLDHSFSRSHNRDRIPWLRGYRVRAGRASRFRFSVPRLLATVFA
jgi:hypothetical protein